MIKISANFRHIEKTFETMKEAEEYALSVFSNDDYVHIENFSEVGYHELVDSESILAVIAETASNENSKLNEKFIDEVNDLMNNEDKLKEIKDLIGDWLQKQVSSQVHAVREFKEVFCNPKPESTEC